MADCYEQLGDYEAALHYALLARDRYQFESFCGTCLADESHAVAVRIRRLERTLSERP
jgi:hypothetical protein